jgi:hypothetical protein
VEKDWIPGGCWRRGGGPQSCSMVPNQSFDGWSIFSSSDRKRHCQGSQHSIGKFGMDAEHSQEVEDSTKWGHTCLQLSMKCTCIRDRQPTTREESTRVPFLTEDCQTRKRSNATKINRIKTRDKNCNNRKLASSITNCLEFSTIACCTYEQL